MKSIGVVRFVFGELLVELKLERAIFFVRSALKFLFKITKIVRNKYLLPLYFIESGCSAHASNTKEKNQLETTADE